MPRRQARRAREADVERVQIGALAAEVLRRRASRGRRRCRSPAPSDRGRCSGPPSRRSRAPCRCRRSGRATIFVAVSLTMPSVGTSAVGSRNRSISCRDAGRAGDAPSAAAEIDRVVSRHRAAGEHGDRLDAFGKVEAGDRVRGVGVGHRVTVLPPSLLRVFPSGF